jgi:hypothetical protein
MRVFVVISLILIVSSFDGFFFDKRITEEFSSTYPEAAERRSVFEIKDGVEDEFVDIVIDFCEEEKDTGEFGRNVWSNVDRKLDATVPHIALIGDYEGRLYEFEGLYPELPPVIIVQHVDHEKKEHENRICPMPFPYADPTKCWFTDPYSITIVTDYYGQEHLCGRTGMDPTVLASLYAMDTLYKMDPNFKPFVTVYYSISQEHYATERMTQDYSHRTIAPGEDWDYKVAQYLKNVKGVSNAYLIGELGFIAAYDILGPVFTNVVKDFMNAQPGQAGLWDNFVMQLNVGPIIGVSSNGALGVNFTCDKHDMTTYSADYSYTKMKIEMKEVTFPENTCYPNDVVLQKTWLAITKSITGFPGIPDEYPPEIKLPPLMPLLAELIPPMGCQSHFLSTEHTNDYDMGYPKDQSMYPSSWSSKWGSYFFYPHPASGATREQVVTQLQDLASMFQCSAVHYVDRLNTPVASETSDRFNYLVDITQLTLQGVPDVVGIPYRFSGAPDEYQYIEAGVADEALLLIPKLLEASPYWQLSFETHQHEYNECTSKTSLNVAKGWYLNFIVNLYQLFTTK